MAEERSQGEPKLSQEQIDTLVRAIDRLERRRRILLAGYLLALLFLVGGQAVAVWIYATTPPDRLIWWIFLVPFTLVGAVLWLFGRWAARLKG